MFKSISGTIPRPQSMSSTYNKKTKHITRNVMKPSSGISNTKDQFNYYQKCLLMFLVLLFSYAIYFNFLIGINSDQSPIIANTHSIIAENKIEVIVNFL